MGIGCTDLKKRLNRTSIVAKVKPGQRPFWKSRQAVDTIYKSMFDTSFFEPRNRRILINNNNNNNNNFF